MKAKARYGRPANDCLMTILARVVNEGEEFAEDDYQGRLDFERGIQARLTGLMAKWRREYGVENLEASRFYTNLEASIYELEGLVNASEA